MEDETLSKAGAHRPPGAGADPRTLKILVISSPKTGNTWLKYLLSEVYHLPIVNVTFGVDRAELLDYGERWVGHQHLFPTETLRRDLRELGVHVITTVRHPADVLVSYFHYVRALAGRQEFNLKDPAAGMLADGDRPGEATLRYARESFSTILLFSAAWLPFAPILVRYEDLRSDPVAELRRVSRQLCPVPECDLESTVAACELKMMRAGLPDQAFHFRQGTTQFQRSEDRLPAAILDVLATAPPYPELNARLGYSFTELPAIKPFDYARLNPFHGRDRFSNGVPITRCIVRAYLRRIPDARTRWPESTDTGPADSFFAHLCAPVDDRQPVVTRLAAYVRDLRDDLIAAYPDPLGWDRWAYIQWFLYSGKVEYELHQSLVAPIILSITALTAPTDDAGHSTRAAAGPGKPPPSHPARAV